MIKLGLSIFLIVGCMGVSCSIPPIDIKYVRDSNGDGKVDELRYPIGSGVVTYMKDSDCDGFFDEKYSLNREGKRYDLPFDPHESKTVPRKEDGMLEYY